MSADQDVHQTQGGASESIRLLGSTFKATEHFDRHGETLTAFSKGIVVLEGQDCGGSKNSHLFAVIDGFEGRSHRHFRFSITHITANQPIHRPLLFHVLFDVLNGRQLVRRFLIFKRFLRFLAQGIIG